MWLTHIITELVDSVFIAPVWLLCLHVADDKQFNFLRSAVLGTVSAVEIMMFYSHSCIFVASLLACLLSTFSFLCLYLHSMLLFFSSAERSVMLSFPASTDFSPIRIDDSLIVCRKTWNDTKTICACTNVLSKLKKNNNNVFASFLSGR